MTEITIEQEGVIALIEELKDDYISFRLMCQETRLIMPCFFTARRTKPKEIFIFVQKKHSETSSFLYEEEIKPLFQLLPLITTEALDLLGKP